MSMVYPLWRELIAGWLINGSGPVEGVTFHLIATDDTYTAEVADATLADIPSDSIVVTEQDLASVTYVGGVFDCADVEITTLTPSDLFDAVVLYMRWPAGNQLMAYLDSSADGSIPATIATTKGWIRFNSNGVFVI